MSLLKPGSIKKRIWRQNNPEKQRLSEERYNNSERGWITNLFNSIRKKNFTKDPTRARKISLGHYELHFTKQEFEDAWAAHKKKYGGMYCGYTGVLMTHKREKMYDPLRNQSLNISVDRLDPEKPYTLDNIIFCTVQFNNKKGSISYSDCLLIMQKFHEYNKTQPSLKLCEKKEG